MKKQCLAIEDDMQAVAKGNWSSEVREAARSMLASASRFYFTLGCDVDVMREALGVKDEKVEKANKTLAADDS